ncbi:MAG: tRNA dihydrouridine synthase DusB [Gammaproteobacteria bacterium]|nr:tRNA dihydrouridine synthase DusB [Gammaproteobacteria bacterium]
MKPLAYGHLSIWPPVVLAPMAGITHYPFRQLCREFGPCLAVSEMVTARSLVENNIKTLQIAKFGPNENPRSIQLYGIDPYYIGEAVKRLVGEDKVDHIDLNFGCPVKKVTRNGGGAALPYKVNLLRSIISQAVKNAENIPITVKCRMGINDQNLTYLDTGVIAQDEGCSAIALHARTAAQMYSGTADWSAIKLLKSTLKYIPVLGNGDIFMAEHVLDMIAKTNCDGVVIGRGCLGRPWLFRDILNLIDGSARAEEPNLQQVIAIMLRHLDLMITWFGEEQALIKFRKDACYYLKGFKSSTKIREIIMTVKSRQQMQDLLYAQDLTESYPITVINEPRGKTGRGQEVCLPYGFLDCKKSMIPIALEAEDDISGG